MLIISGSRQWPDHDMHAPIARLCDGSWWFACDFTETRTVKGKKVKEQCPRRHRVSCDGGQHIPLDVAEFALLRAGWRKADGGGHRCPQHSP